MMTWAKEVFGTEKPIIAMCHVRALPGDPGYDKEKGMDWVVQKAYEDLMALQKGGVDAVMFSNEFSLPYMTKVRTECTAAMARVIGQLMPEIKVPFGVNMLWDPYASLDLAAATGACFVREVINGVYASDLGLWNNDAGSVVRHRAELGIRDKCRLLYNIYPESAVYLGGRDVAEIAKSTNFTCKPDVILVSGLTAGVATDNQILARVKAALPDTYVFCNTGCRPETIKDQLAIADGAIVGTTFKKDGKFDNFVDYERVVTFMEAARARRQ